MRKSIVRFSAMFALACLVACGGGGGGGSSGNPNPDPIDSDPALVTSVQNALANPANPDASLQEFYELSAGVSPDTATKSFLDALQTSSDVDSAYQVMLNSGQIFGFEPTVQPAGISVPCGSPQQIVVWYVNGIWTTAWGALEGLREVKSVVSEANLGVNPNLILLFYNKSGLDGGIASSDLCKNFFGANGAEDSSCATKQTWQDTLALFACGGLTDLAEAFAQWANQWLNFDLNVDDPEISEFRSAIQQDIDSGKKVIIIAHSQGNFFAQRALEGISSADRKAIGVVALASPTPYPQQGSYGYFSYLTLEKDFIIQFNSAFDFNGTNALTQSGADGFEIHSLKCSYLGQPTSRSRIKQMLQQANSSISNPNALGANGYVEITAKWFVPGDLGLFVGEKDYNADLGAEVWWEDPAGGPAHLFGYIDHLEDTGPGFEHYVVCSKNDLREACFIIRLYNKSLPAGSRVEVTVKAGTKVWAFTVFVDAPDPVFGSITSVTDLHCHSDKTFHLSSDCELHVFPAPGGISEQSRPR